MLTTDKKNTYQPDLKTILSPRSVAVVGASSRDGSVGQAIFRNLQSGGYKGELYPINPKSVEIGGIKCFPTLTAIGKPVDLAILIIPNTSVPGVLEECARLNIHGAMVISAGFKEIGGAGIALEEQIKQISTENKIALIGPNCLGFINTDSSVALNASFGSMMPKEGNIAFVSQSGALCASVLDYARAQGIGFSKFISMGNKAVVNELDFLRALGNDPKTDVILMYLEDISDGKEFIELARHITGEIKVPKPILAIKSGRTAEGAKAASSHTGSLAGSDEVYDAIFAQSGVMRVETVEELFDFAVAFSRQPIPKGNRVAIITNAGGPGILATDAAVRHGLVLAKLEPATEAELAKVLPPTANIKNPVDVIGDARHDRYEAAIRPVLQDPNVDGVVIILTPQAMTDSREIGEVVANIEREKKKSAWSHKPILASFMGVMDVSEGVHIIEAAGIPHYIFPEAAVRALAQMYKYQKIWLTRPRTQFKSYPVDKKKVEDIFKKVRAEKRTYLPELEALHVFDAYGIPVLKSALAKTEQEAVKAADGMGYPVVLKISSPAIVHKLDAGGVLINLKDSTAVANGFRQIYEKSVALVGADKIWGIEVQKMSEKGVEVFLGSKHDPKFGPVVVFGLGGTYVEVFRDVSFRLAPLREWTTRAMIEQCKAAKILHGYRGVPSDIKKLSECLGRLGQLVTDFPEILELDINPFIVYAEGKGGMAVDGRLLLSDLK